MRRGLPSILIAAALCVATLACPPPARAGEYIVHACSPSYGNVNRSWTLNVSTPALVGYACSQGQSWDRGMVTRLNPRSGSVPMYTAATYTFRAPAGTSLSHMQYDRAFCGGNGFRAGVWTPASGLWDMAGPGCSTMSPQDLPLYGAGEVNLTTQCAQPTCSLATSAEIHGAMSNIRVFVNDPTPPSVSLAGGTIKTSEWQRGVRTAVVSASDASGINEVLMYLDNARVGSLGAACDYTHPVPCAPPSNLIAADTRLVADGRRTLRITARDSAGNVNATSVPVYVDNNAPGSPLDFRLSGEATWRTTNDFSVSWINPAQSNASPINAARWFICPGKTPSNTSVGCKFSGVNGLNITRVQHLQVPSVGEWQLRLWIGDRAGNASQGTARAVLLRLDNVPPTLRLAEADPMDPQRVTVSASDQNAGIARGDIEIRRQGTDAWISLPVRMTPTGFTTIVDDASLADGIYDLRARAVDRAGNERTTEVRASGAAAHLVLPLRVPTSLNAGGVRVVRGSHGRRREVLVSTATAPYGRRVQIRGRLTTAGGNPLVNADLDVMERTALPDQPWVRVGIVRTGPDGGFAYTALRGPSRAVRFSYAGTSLIRPKAADVSVRVRAKTTIDVSRRAVVNGDEVVFRGRVRGGPMPSTGKLLQLQAYSRGGWRTFATPRASARTRKWRFGYRFTATRGTVRYRFRAVLPREGGFPFVRGASRSLKVVVHGL